MLRLLLALTLLAGPALAQKAGPAPAPPAPSGKSGPSAPTPGPGRPGQANREILLRNNSQSALREVYLWEGAASARSQGPDRLGADMVAAGRTYRLNLGRVGCQMRLRAVFEDGSAEARPVDVCQTRELVLDDSNTRPVDITNNTDAELMQLYLARPDAAGPDRLGSATVPANDSFRIRLRGETGCEFEARAVFRGSREAVRQPVNLCTTPSIAFGDPAVPLREITVANRSRRVMRELYAAAGTGAWGPDRLGSAVLAPGQSILLRTRSQECRVRLRAVFADNRALEQTDVDLCGGQPVTFSTARRVTLVQNHARPVREAYLSDIADSDWGANLLAAPLPNGQRREIGTDGGCRADLRIVFDNGNAEEARNIDICARTEIELKPGWVAE
ncbi:hypothetical protein EJV46_21730 [Roseococcus sp. SYP-B2431]|uniref:hypothetical protein n=1 Tax=Roseococcus sp. SYP-B2431 TaxID=2496640 RepID=UPI00103DCCEC|nr:hypothetical protein [Roseococcus sp. SYP-B2431]TCH96203.1 hypothetical protein EJV46_21730 [Roseococcus sp. SYP-B2431]